MCLPLIGMFAMNPVTPQPPSSACFPFSNVPEGNLPGKRVISSTISFKLRILFNLYRINFFFGVG